jgi:hypothetical protein
MFLQKLVELFESQESSSYKKLFKKTHVYIGLINIYVKVKR